MKKALLSQTRLFMIQCLLTMILAFSFNSAHAQRNGGWGNNGHTQNVQTVQSYIGQYMYEGQHINLTKKLDLAQALRQGKQLLTIKVKAQSSSYNSKVVLKINGQKVDSKQLSSYSSTVTFYAPRVNAYDKVSLKIKGSVYIAKVSADIKSTYNPGPGGQGNSIAINVNQTFQGSQRVSLSRLVSHGPRINPHKEIKSITIKARGHGIIKVAGAGSTQSIQVQGPTSQTLKVYGYSTVKDLMLRVKATGRKVVIEQVRIKFKAGRY